MKHQKGFSLVELSIVIAVVGVMFLAIPVIAPVVQKMLVSQSDEESLNKAEAAIKGFLIANSRLPCPDSNGDGNENCAINSGSLPFRTLGLAIPVKNSFGQLIAYSVYRQADAMLGNDTDLASLKDRYQPLLPNNEVSNISNGLDFCWGLKTAISATSITNTAHVGSGSSLINQAYVLASAGGLDADGNGSLFDGMNQIGNVGFDLPSRIINASYDDSVRSMGFAELAGKLQCPTLLASVNGAARRSFAMHDIMRIKAYNARFRQQAFEVHQGNVTQAKFNVALAAADAAIFVAQTVIGIAGGAQSFGVAIIGVIAVPAVISGALTAKAVVDAATGLIDAEESRDTAEQQRNEANIQKAEIDGLYVTSIARAKALDAKGWFQ